MKAEMNHQAEQYIRQNKTKRKATTIVAVLSVLVALLTTYILMLPGITMEYGMVCGLEEHQHTELCYAAGLVCGLEESEALTTENVTMTCTVQPHEHSNDCFDSHNVRICGLSTEVFHTHNDVCYDGEGNLLCTLPQNPPHTHNSDCYKKETRLVCQLAESAGHQHTAECQTQVVATEPACGLTESAGHVHEDACFIQTLTCALAESVGHQHDDSCNTTESVLTCTEPETPAHVHSEACVNELGGTICGMEEGQGGHTHGETCYTQSTTLTCGQEAGVGAHAHSDNCYSPQTVCGLNEGDGAHAHTEACYPAETVNTCGKEAGQDAHAHTDACYTTDEQLVCNILHQHSDACFEKGSNGRDCVICGMDQVPEHQHTEACRQVTVQTTEGHIHTEECHGQELACQLTEHLHEDACYPQEEVVVTATPEVAGETTATETPAPEVAGEATAMPTPDGSAEPTATPEAPAATEANPSYLCGIPEHRHSAECLDGNGVLLCGYAQEHLHGELCMEDLTSAVFYCGMEEHLHGFLCFDADNNLICAMEIEHRHSDDCLEDPAAVTYFCGLDAHWHEEGCYDGDGNLTCALKEHVHDDACNPPAMLPNNLIMTLEDASAQDPTNDWSDFGQYVQHVSASDVVYKPGEGNGAYHAHVYINFTVDKEAFAAEQFEFTYYLPETVGIVSTDIYEREVPIMRGDEEVGYFQIMKDDYDKNYLAIYFDEDEVSTESDCTGNLHFQCSIDDSATQNNGDVYVKFENEVPLEIGNASINHPEDETAFYSLEAVKTGPNGQNNLIYDPTTHTLTYQISVKSKGTPADITLEDTLEVKLNGQTLAIDASDITITAATYNGQNTTIPSFTIDSANRMTLTLPKVDRDQLAGTEGEYLITYTVKVDELANLGFQNTDMSAKNKLTTVSDDNPNDLNSPNRVADSSPDIDTHYQQNVLAKSGNYNYSTDQVDWVISFNAAQTNVNGLLLTDEMLATLQDAQDITITPNTGYTIQESGGKVTGILFGSPDSSDASTANSQKYTITYHTHPQSDYASSATESNTVTVTDPKNPDIPLEKVTSTVGNYTRNQQVGKGAVGTLNDDKTQVDLIWTIDIPVDENGLNNNVTITDKIQPNVKRHYMTFEQLKELYKNVKDLAVDGKVLVKQMDEHGNTAGNQLNVGDIINDAATYANDKFIEFTFDLDETKVNNKLNNTFPSSLKISYPATIDVVDLQYSADFYNDVTVGNTKTQGKYSYVLNTGVLNPVDKYCLECGDLSKNECTHQKANDIMWAVNVYQDKEYEYFTFEDTLPTDVDLKMIRISAGSYPHLDLSLVTDESGNYIFTQKSNGDTSDIVVTGTYDPATKKVSLKVSKASKETFNNNMGYGAEKLMKFEIHTNLSNPEPKKTYPLINNVQVNLPNGKYDDDTYTTTVTVPKIITKKGVNGNTSEADTESTTYDSNNFGWIVELQQSQEYSKLEATDTLPQGIILNKIKVGKTEIPVITNADGSLSFETFQYHQEQQGLVLVPTYADGKVTITVTRNEEVKDEEWNTRGLGNGETMHIQYYCAIPEDQQPSVDRPSVSLTYANSAEATFTPASGDLLTDTDTQTQKLDLTYVAPVIKSGVYNGQESSETLPDVQNSTGVLEWKVKITQKDDYETLTIIDTLPEGVELNTLTSRNGNDMSIMLDSSKNLCLKMGEAGTDGIIPLILYNDYNSGIPPYIASYNPANGQISIQLTELSEWRKSYGDLFAAGKELNLTYYCKLTEDHMPDNENGEYRTEMRAYRNSVRVTVDNDVELGNDTHTQNVTIVQNEPEILPVTKFMPEYDDMRRLLHYRLDVNPTRQDIDVASDSITLVDTLSYTAGNEARKLTLKQDTVKLYYAQTNENGKPIKDVNGQLVKGELIDPSLWSMIYQENDAESWNQTTRIMTLSIPDETALILEYDYKISMAENSSAYGLGLNVSNTAKIAETNLKESGITIKDEYKWKENTAGGTADMNLLTLIKHDADNQANVLQGVVFKLQKYAVQEDNTYAWVDVNADALDSMVTSATGTITIDKAKAYESNVLYRVVEVSTLTGYYEPSSNADEATVLYFYKSETDAEGSSVAIPTPSADVLSSAYDLQTQAGQTIRVPNQRKTTSLSVRKDWVDQSGNALTEHPASVKVELRRYAVPESVWDGLVAGDSGINGGQTVPGTMTDVTLELRSNNDVVTTTTRAAIGSKLKFRVNINGARHDHRPVFNGIQPITKSETDSSSWYDFSVVVTPDMVLSGQYLNASNAIWVGSLHINTGNSTDYITFTTEASDKAPPNTSAFASQLSQYVDLEYSQTITLSKDNSWGAQWSRLPYEGEDSNGNKVHYKYYVTETPPDGYSATITGFSSDDGGGYTVTNTKDGSTIKTTNLRVEKEWYNATGEKYTYNSDNDSWSIGDKTYQYDGEDWWLLDADGNRSVKVDDNTAQQLPLPSVSVQLVRTNKRVSNSSPEVVVYNNKSTTTINADTGWVYNFTDLLAEKRDGNGVLLAQYDYFIREVDNNGQFVAELVDDGTVEESGKTYKLVRLKNAAPQTISVSVEKKWEGVTVPEGVNSVTVQLQRQISTDSGYVVDDTFTPVEVTLDNNKQWKHTWDTLSNGEVVDGVAKSYSYRITEIKVNDVAVETSAYEPVYSTEDGRVAAGETLTITNQPRKETKQITVKKVWKDVAGNAIAAPADASVTVQLVRRAGVDGAEELVTEQPPLVLNASNDWQETLTGLEKYVPDANGASTATEYIYYFKETAGPDGYIVSYSYLDADGNFIAPEDDEVTITNTSDGPYTSVKVDKVWKDSDGSDLNDHPDSVSMQLYRVAMTQVDWQAYVDGLGQGGSTTDPEDPGTGGGTGGETEQVTLTFDLQSNNNSFGKLQYSCDKGETVTLKIEYIGTGNNYSFQIHKGDWNSIVNQNKTDNCTYAEFTIPSENTQSDMTYYVQLALDSNTAPNINDWSITQVTDSTSTTASSYALQRSTTFTPPEGEATPVGEAITLPNGGQWSYEWTNQLVNSGSEYYFYYVEESLVEGYIPSVECAYDQTAGTYSYTVTNTKDETYTPPDTPPDTPTQLVVNKEWGAGTIPEDVQFRLMRMVGDPAAGGSVDMTFTVRWTYNGQQQEQPKGYTVSVGNKIVWVVDIPASAGDVQPEYRYATYGNSTIQMHGEGEETGWPQDQNQDGYKTYMSDPFAVLSSSSGKAEIVWDTNVSTGTEFIFEHSVNITVDAEEVGTYTIPVTGSQYIFDDLPATDNEGNTYYYFVEEVDTGKYQISYENNAGVAPGSDPITIINNPLPSQNLSLTVKKVWQDANGNAMDPPTTYAVQYEIWAKDGTAAEDGGTLSAENQWNATHDLPAGKDYYVVETSILNGGQDMKNLYDITYTAGENGTPVTDASAATVDADGTLTITNKLKPTYVLPETGGMGTHLYTGAGALLTGIALTLLYRRNQRKRRANE